MMISAYPTEMMIRRNKKVEILLKRECGGEWRRRGTWPYRSRIFLPPLVNSKILSNFCALSPRTPQKALPDHSRSLTLSLCLSHMRRNVTFHFLYNFFIIIFTWTVIMMHAQNFTPLNSFFACFIQSMKIMQIKIQLCYKKNVKDGILEYITNLGLDGTHLFKTNCFLS